MERWKLKKRKACIPVIEHHLEGILAERDISLNDVIEEGSVAKNMCTQESDIDLGIWLYERDREKYLSHQQEVHQEINEKGIPYHIELQPYFTMEKQNPDF